MFVLPSTEPEPYGLVLVEALMSGARVVATDEGGPPEILGEAEPHSGQLVPVRDPGAMARAILGELAAVPATSTAVRATRHPRRAPEPERFAAIFRSVVGSTP